MKKLLITLLIGVVALTSVFAGVLNFNLGAAAMYNKGFKDLVEERKVAIGDFSFGLDTDVKFIILGSDVTALYSKVGDDIVINGTISANVVLDMAVLRLAAGLGYDYVWNITQKVFSYGGVSKLSEFKDAKLLMRAEVSFLLDKLHLGVFATLPTNLTINNFAEEIKQMDFTKVWERANYGLFLKISLI